MADQPLRMGRVATIDLGTNTVLLLVAEIGPDGEMEILHEEERFVRLGEGVDATGQFSREAMDRVLSAIRAYGSQAESLGAPVVTLAATSASRDAANVAALAGKVEELVGTPYQILSGEQEALWSFRGALSAFPDIVAATVLDVGGGSTELISGGRDDPGVVQRSFDMGAVRLTERYFENVPPSPHAVEQARGFVAEQLGHGEWPLRGPLIGAAGTVGALARVATGAVGGHAIPYPLVQHWLARLLSMSPGEVRSLAPDVLTGREDVFAAGVLIIEAVMHHLRTKKLIPSPRGLLHGLALRWRDGL